MIVADMSRWSGLLARTYDLVREPVEHLQGSALDRPTPCSEWTTRAVFEHLIWAIDMFATGAGASPVAAPAGGTPVERFDAAVARNLDAWRSVTDPEAPVTLTFGTFPGSMAAAQNQLDSLVHGWDLAAALDLPYDMPGELARAALQTAEARFRARPRGQWYGPPVAPRDDTARERLLALTGRDTTSWPATR